LLTRINDVVDDTSGDICGGVILHLFSVSFNSFTKDKDLSLWF